MVDVYELGLYEVRHGWEESNTPAKDCFRGRWLSKLLLQAYAYMHQNRAQELIWHARHFDRSAGSSIDNLFSSGQAALVQNHKRCQEDFNKGEAEVFSMSSGKTATCQEPYRRYCDSEAEILHELDEDQELGRRMSTYG